MLGMGRTPLLRFEKYIKQNFSGDCMTKEEAANRLISMYHFYCKNYSDTNGSMNAAVTLAVAVLAESAGRDACEECQMERSQLSELLTELRAIRAHLESR